MKKTIPAGAIAAIIIPVLLASCGHSDNTTPQTSDPVIREFAVNQTIKSSDRAYLVALDGDSVYFDLSTSIHWPEKIGDADLSPLRDSLIAFCYADTTLRDINPAIIAYMRNTSMVDSLSPDETITPLDSMPAPRDDMHTWFASTSATIIELNEEMATYDVSTSSYYGGAHPFTASHPFTYDLRKARVLTVADMFIPGSTPELMQIIISALARQLDTTPAGLERAGIFTSQLTYPGAPYIQSGALVFHYNPYDIAPYSAGPIDVTVYPYEVSHILTPDVRALFADQF